MNAIVRFARSRDILCQGRGSAANSAVCYVLGITSIDPNDLLFEHFVSEERREPPDIDVDFEHERREIVMQWVFDTYGRDHAALCSTVIRYRAKGALRDAGKALSLPEDLIKLLSSQVWGWSREGIEPKHAEELNLNPGDRRLRLAIANGYERDFAEKTFKQLEGFGSYGFPESHAASFALIAYASSWLKCHHPDVFCAALLNAQPMGFYAPAQIVRDARDHGGVDVRPVCVNASRFDCTLEPTEEGDRFAVRLGLRIFPLPHGRGDELNHGSPGLDPRSLPPKGLEVRDVHFPDLHIDTIKMKTREFR